MTWPSLKIFRRMLFVSCSLWCLLSGCGGTVTDGGEDYGNLLDSPEGLVLTEDEHDVGWGHSECTMCHNLENIHLVNRTEIAIDIEAIHEQALEEGLAVCSDCHGTNGVP